MREDLVRKLDEYLQHEAEQGKYLDHFAEKWNVTRGLISRWRTGAKRISIDKAPDVFSDVHGSSPTEESSSDMVVRYFREYPSYHELFKARKHKFDTWDSANDGKEAGSLQPICRYCGDPEEDHKKHGCNGCGNTCKSYVARVRRGKRTDDSYI